VRGSGERFFRGLRMGPITVKFCKETGICEACTQHSHASDWPKNDDDHACGDVMMQCFDTVQ